MNDSIDNLLLRALNELEPLPGRSFVKSARVLAKAIEYAGLLTQARKSAIYTEVDPPADVIITRFHAALVALIHEADPAKRLVQGQGNFGSADESEPPANPLFTECRLTDLGRAFVAA